MALKVEDAWKESGSEALLASEFRSINLYRSLTLVHFPHYLVHGDLARTRESLKCGYTNHNAKSCSFKFKRSCFKCNGPHMTFLCYRDSKNTVTAKLPHLDKSNVKSTATNVVATVSMATESFNDVILPTATVYFPGAQDVPVRIFKDIGSQSSFVKGTPKTIPNCTVLRKVRVKVKGINSVKSYKPYISILSNRITLQ